MSWFDDISHNYENWYSMNKFEFTVKVTFNNISAILWLSVLLAEETGGLGENHRPTAIH
jgi:hypothetical protein